MFAETIAKVARTMRLLIIEDDRDAADYLVKAFREAGHVADHAADGEEGLALASHEHYDVLVVDRLLPKLDGLSVIGALRTKGVATPALIRQASDIALAAGADFLKTSTGKVAVNATPEAAAIMLQAIRDSGRPCGFKAAGGVRTADDAARYLQLATDIMGAAWLTPANFRFGASGLLANLQAVVQGGAITQHSGY